MEGMIKRALLLLTLSVTLVPNAFAMQWKHLGSDENKTHYFFKPKTYSLKNKVASAWTKKEYNVDVNLMTLRKIQADEYKGNKSVVAYEEFNCTEKKKRTVVGKTYEKNDDTDIGKTNWTPVQPGSIDEGLLTALCNEGGNINKEIKAPEKK